MSYETPIHALQFARDLFGSQASLARAIEADPSFVNQWFNEIRPIPIKYCARIEAVTEKKVTRQDLRPKDYFLYWPELDDRKTLRRQTDTPRFGNPS